MTPILKLINKYAILIGLSIILTTTWFYFKGIILTIDDLHDYNSLWHNLHTIISFLFKSLIAILLFIDTRKFGINYILIPVSGFVYPLLGVSVFLILFVYKNKKASA